MRNSRVAAFCAAFVFALAAAAAHALLPIQHWQTKHGARVYFVENHDLPIIDLSLDVPAGSGFDTPAKAGVASMTNHMLRLGADGLTEDEIARRFADVGAQFGPRFDYDRAGVGLRTLSSRKERDQAIDLFVRILRRPEFPQAVLEREKVRVIGAIKEADTRPEDLSDRIFQRLIYPDHPYGLRPAGEVETVQKISRADLVAFHRAHYTAEHAVIAVVGDMTRAQVEALAERIAANLPPPSGAPAAPPPVPELAGAVTRYVEHPASQSHIVVGAPAIRRDDPHYFALLVGNFVLGGGGLVSRISIEVRDKRGLAYSAASYFVPLKREGPFAISLQTQREHAHEALNAARDTLKAFVAKGPTAIELREAKQNIIRGFPLRIDTNAKIHGYLRLIGFYRLPLTYLDDFVKNIERVSADDVRRAFQKHIDPQRMATVLVAATEQSTPAGQPER